MYNIGKKNIDYANVNGYLILRSDGYKFRTNIMSNVLCIAMHNLLRWHAVTHDAVTVQGNL